MKEASELSYDQEMSTELQFGFSLLSVSDMTLFWCLRLSLPCDWVPLTKTLGKIMLKVSFWIVIDLSEIQCDVAPVKFVVF